MASLTRSASMAFLRSQSFSRNNLPRLRSRASLVRGGHESFRRETLKKRMILLIALNVLKTGPQTHLAAALHCGSDTSRTECSGRGRNVLGVFRVLLNSISTHL